MVLCALCQVWQHAICFGFLEEKSVPNVHICILCSKEHGRHCTDPSLTSLAQEKLKVRISNISTSPFAFPATPRVCVYGVALCMLAVTSLDW